MRTFEGFIFDIDGTLTSTNELIFATFNHVAEKYLNKTLSNEEIISLFGPTEDEILLDWMGDKFVEARQDYFEFYEANHKKMADIYPGIIEILDLIKKEGLPISIYTGKGRKTSEITLKKIGVFEYFDMIITGDDILKSKPSPEGIDKFIDKFKLQKDKVLMIGDSPVDIETARNAGIKVASVLWDSYAKEKVLQLKSDYFFHSVKELENFIKENI